MLNRLKIKLASDRHFRELVIGSSESLILRVLTIIMGYISILYITHNYGASELGILTLLISVVLMFSVIPRFGMDVALVRVIGELFEHSEYAEIKRVFRKVFIWTVCLAILFMSLLYFSGDFISRSISKPHISHYMRLMSVTIVAMVIIEVAAATVLGIRRAKESVFIRVTAIKLLFLALLLADGILSYFNDLVYIYVTSVVAATTLSIALVLRAIKQLKTGNTNGRERKYNLKKVLTIASPMLLAGSFIMIMNHADIIMLGFFKAETDIGIYTVAQRTAGLVGIILLAINTIMAQKFTEFYSKKDIQGLQRITKQSTKLLFLYSLPLLLILFILPSWVMSLFGDEFIIGATALMLASASQLVNAVSGSVICLMQMTDNQIVFRNIATIAMLINITLNYLIIPEYGINGAAFSTMISTIFLNMALVIFIKRKLGFWTVSIPRISKL